MSPTPEQMEALARIPKEWAQPPDSVISKLNRGKGVVLDYVSHADTTLIMLQIDPAWTIEYDRSEDGRLDVYKQGNNWVLAGRLTMLGVTRECVGTCQSNKAEVEKELLGDVLRNGAMRFGLGTALWSKLDDATDRYTAEAPADRAMTDDEVDKFEANCVKNGLDFHEIMLDAHMSNPPMISEKPALARAFTAAKKNAVSPSNDPVAPAPTNEPETLDMDTGTPLPTDPGPSDAEIAHMDAEDGKFLASRAQVTKIQILLGEYGLKDRDARLLFVQDALNMSRRPTSTKNLTTDEAHQLIEQMEDK